MAWLLHVVQGGVYCIRPCGLAIVYGVCLGTLLPLGMRLSHAGGVCVP